MWLLYAHCTTTGETEQIQAYAAMINPNEVPMNDQARKGTHK